MNVLIWLIISARAYEHYGLRVDIPKIEEFLPRWGENSYVPFSEVGGFISGILTCPMCFSFHGGWFLSITIFSPTFYILNTPMWYGWFFDAILSSGAVWGINAVVEWFEENRPSK